MLHALAATQWSRAGYSKFLDWKLSPSIPAIKLWGVHPMPICQGCLLAGVGAALALGSRQLLEALGRQKLELGRQKGAEAGVCQQPHRALEGQVHHVAVVAPGEGPDLPLPSQGRVPLPLHALLC